jgi:hypothetical protein
MKLYVIASDHISFIRSFLNYMLTRPILLVKDDNGASNPAGKISGYDLDIVPSLSLG